MEDPIGIDEAIKILGVSRAFLQRQINRKKGPVCFRLSHKTVIFERKHVLEWLERKRISN